MGFRIRFYAYMLLMPLALLLGACANVQQVPPLSRLFPQTIALETITPAPTPAMPIASRTARAVSTSTPAPSPDKHILGPEPTEFVTHTPRPGATPIPTIAFAPSISVTTQIHVRPLDQYPSSLTLDEDYIYWARGWNGDTYRFPIYGGAEEFLARSQFYQRGDGYLYSQWFVRAGDWFIYTDTRLYDTGVWALHALNLETKQDTIVMQETGSHAPAWSPLPYYSAEGDWLAWSRLELGDPMRCDQSVLGITNLASGEERELDRVCTLGHYMWIAPLITGDHLIIEQDLPDAQGRQNNIFLWNWKTGERTALTTTGYSSMPAVSGKWVVWKEAPRYTESRNYIIYNLETGARQSIRGLGCWMDPRVSGHWLYSGTCKNLTIYDLEQQRMVEVVKLPKGDKFYGAIMSDEWAVWGVVRETSLGKEYEFQWRRLP